MITLRRSRHQEGPSPLWIAWALVLALGFLVDGCSRTSAYRAPVGKFRDASSVVVESTKIYLTELNKTERDAYIFGQVADTSVIKLDELERRQAFSKEGIAARLDALDQLANYAALLDQLANSDAPQRIKANATDLDSSLTRLSSQISKLTGADDRAFQAVANKTLPVLGDVLQAFVEGKIEAGLKKAIENSDTTVNELIKVIESDADLAFQRKRTQLSGMRNLAVDRYNDDIGKRRKDRSTLEADARAISEEEDRWETFLVARPNDGLKAMREANSALVKFAKTPNPDVKDFASFVDAIELFAATANRVGEAVKQLKSK